MKADLNFLEVYSPDRKGKMPDLEIDEKLLDPELYKPSRDLQDAVNVAIWLGKPLLLTGEPGTGKTQLAYSVAHRLGLGDPLRFNVRTTSVANDLFYKYDAIRHFQFNQNNKNHNLDKKEIESNFITYQPLGQAIRSNTRQVVLVDEIDKAPRDLPNDILNVLEDLVFDVPEIGETFEAAPTKRPFIIFTSNSEKNLPDAFLRRCVYYHIPFPTDDEMLDILSTKTSSALYSISDIKDIIIPHFKVFRNLLRKKKPSTGELLNWLVLLERRRFSASKFPLLSNNTAQYTEMQKDDRDALLGTLSVLSKTEEDVRAIKKLFGVQET